jgi:hypothetical protein
MHSRRISKLLRRTQQSESLMGIASCLCFDRNDHFGPLALHKISEPSHNTRNTASFRLRYSLLHLPCQTRCLHHTTTHLVPPQSSTRATSRGAGFQAALLSPSHNLGNSIKITIKMKAGRCIWEFKDGKCGSTSYRLLHMIMPPGEVILRLGADGSAWMIILPVLLPL